MSAKAFNYKTALIPLAGALVLCSCVAGGWVWYLLKETVETRSDTRMLLITWQQLYSNLKDAETGARGYVITEDARYLEPFEKAIARLPEDMESLSSQERELANGYSVEKLAQFRKFADDFLGKMREVITVVRREGKEFATAILKDDSAKNSMDQVRERCETRTAELNDSLRLLDARLALALTSGGRSIIALAISGLIAGIAAGAMLRDASLQARRAERLVAEKQRADRANVEKSTFLATMSHEIRTPMNAILGFGELLLTDARDDKQRRYAQSIVRSGQALLQLINDILDLSKIEAGMIDLSTNPLNVRELAEFTRQLFSHQCASKGIDLRVDVDQSVPPSLLLDGARLRQVVINLVGNAIKFTTAGHVALRFHGERASGSRSTFGLVIEVEDTGAGIPASRIGDIFDPFVQAKASRDAELKGTGLGLAIVKRLVNLMAGTVSVSSEEGKGSCFKVTLPNVEISARLPQTLVVSQEDVDFNVLKPSHILVVDDNPTNIAVIQGYFDHTHHTITTASNGQQALEWLEHRRPDVVLMDIRMPVMDGRTALVELRKREQLALLPIIALTASSLAGEERDLRGSFDGYLRKPYSRAELFAELSQFIARQTEAVELNAFTDTTPATPAWSSLTQRLRDLERNKWVSVSDGMVMSEVTAFASTLASLAHSAQCPPLQSYASTLQQQAEGFALQSLEQTLAAFPALIARIEQRIANPSVS